MSNIQMCNLFRIQKKQHFTYRMSHVACRMFNMEKSFQGSAGATKMTRFLHAGSFCLACIFSQFRQRTYVRPLNNLERTSMSTERNNSIVRYHLDMSQLILENRTRRYRQLSACFLTHLLYEPMQAHKTNSSCFVSDN